MIIDLHVHSKYASDGVLDPKTIAKIGFCQVYGEWTVS